MFTNTYTLFQLYLNHIRKLKSTIKTLALEALIKKVQRATVNLCNHDELHVLGITNDTTPSPPNNSLGGLLPQKSIIDVL